MQNKFVVRKAREEEYLLVKDFYDNLIDRISEFEYRPGWEKGVYPAYEYLKDSIENGTIYIGLLEESVISAMIVNEQGNESYNNACWKNDLKEGDYLVIHALGVMPSEEGKGFGRKMVEYVIQTAEPKYKAIRLDVLKGNKSANRLYEAVGFELVDTVKMYYEDTGWTDFELYEYELRG